MGELKEVKFGREYTPSMLLDDLLKEKNDFEYCIFLGVKKDSSQVMLTSTISQEEKCFLTSFLNTIIAKFFKLENING